MTTITAQSTRNWTDPLAGTNVQALEWGLARYRFSADAVDDRLMRGLTANFVDEFETLRDYYGRAVGELCNQDVCEHPSYREPARLVPN